MSQSDWIYFISCHFRISGWQNYDGTHERKHDSEFSTFLKELVNTGYSRYPIQELGKRISLGRPHLYQYSVRRSQAFFETESYTCQFCLWFHEHELSCWYGKCHHNGDERCNPEEFCNNRFMFQIRSGINDCIYFIAGQNSRKIALSFHSWNSVIKNLSH